MSTILVQFVFRLTFGMALSMAVTPASLVTSGFYRVHLWVLMGLNTFAALVLYRLPEAGREALTAAVSLAAASYVGSVVWLYERRRVGVVLLWLISLGGLAGAVLTAGPAGAVQASATTGRLLPLADLVSSGLLMGAAITAMLLGHWYLNTPTMKLAPLKRLVAGTGAAVALRSVVCGAGLLLSARAGLGDATFLFWTFVVFRWLAGLLGVLLLTWMTWQTLKVPNTQSATGILYAAVVLVFLGELVGQLLSADSAFPL